MYIYIYIYLYFFIVSRLAIDTPIHIGFVQKTPKNPLTTVSQALNLACTGSRNRQPKLVRKYRFLGDDLLSFWEGRPPFFRWQRRMVLGIFQRSCVFSCGAYLTTFTGVPPSLPIASSPPVPRSRCDPGHLCGRGGFL